MIRYRTHRAELAEKGFTVIPNVYSGEEVTAIGNRIAEVDSTRPTFRKTADLFAIRQFLKEVPQVVPELFTPQLNALITEMFGADYFVVKSIYFDKPGSSNWFVSYHQDLTISVVKKADVAGFGPWSVKQNQYAVQPPLAILEENVTIRMHLDDTDSANGALRVIPGSHTKGIYRPETIDWTKEQEVSCPVPKGGIMIMKPLLLHASGRTTDNRNRRVIHLEFSRKELPQPLTWSERLGQNG